MIFRKVQRHQERDEEPDLQAYLEVRTLPTPFWLPRHAHRTQDNPPLPFDVPKAHLQAPYLPSVADAAERFQSLEHYESTRLDLLSGDGGRRTDGQERPSMAAAAFWLFRQLQQLSSLLRELKKKRILSSDTFTSRFAGRIQLTAAAQTHRSIVKRRLMDPFTERYGYDVSILVFMAACTVG
jgi:hypothetical protein